jgi:hypothetical protein
MGFFFFFERYLCFFNSGEQAYFEQIEHFSPLATMMGKQYYFQKLTQFSQKNNGPDSQPSHLDVFF